MKRTAEVHRKTFETDIRIALNIDGSGKSLIDTGIGFFDHMLTHIARHGLMDIELSAMGDLEVDFHHTVEDVGLCFGEALRKTVGDKQGIRRYGFFLLPMDEALAQVAVDLSGRPLLVYSNPLASRAAGAFTLDLVRVFLQALADRAALTLHVSVNAENPHHAAEAIFKGIGKALAMAVEKDPRVVGAPSTKGALD
jgi:imidazoleglycerol-phosphate dehydratase